MKKNKTSYIWSQDLLRNCDRLPAVAGRASMVHNLIESYGLLKHIQVVTSAPATYEDLKLFHSEIYLDHLKTYNEIDDDYMTTTQEEEMGIGYDCPPVSNMFELVSSIAGSSITASRCLMMGLADVAINWSGGWHHASRFSAEGFCYVNDIVIAIEYLRKKFPKVLYIDLDVHHGNGVEDAYNLSKTVFTLSFHKHEPGFYPGTGSVEDLGNLVGKGYTCNFPLHAAYGDETIKYCFERVFASVHSSFNPDAIVVQCGADALSRDPHGGANLTQRGYEACLRTVLLKHKPTLLLGGGGYNNANTARVWTSLTALVAGISLEEDIPDHDGWELYGPEYILPIQPTLVRDANKKSYLDDCILRIRENIEKYFHKLEDTGPEEKKCKLETSSNNEIKNGETSVKQDKRVFNITEVNNPLKEINVQRPNNALSANIENSLKPNN